MRLHIRDSDLRVLKSKSSHNHRRWAMLVQRMDREKRQIERVARKLLSQVEETLFLSTKTKKEVAEKVRHDAVEHVISSVMRAQRVWSTELRRRPPPAGTTFPVRARRLGSGSSQLFGGTPEPLFHPSAPRSVCPGPLHLWHE